MKPTKEQLADPKWWDANVPADVTHFCVETRVERPQETPAQWRGPQDGLPPVGELIEWRELTGLQWVKARVLFISDKSVVLQRADGFEWQMITKRAVFRAIETPEQKAAREREEAVAEMLSIFGGTDSRDTYLMQRLYDAGYRKQPEDK